MLTATYTFDGASYEGTVTFELPDEIDLSTSASITIGDSPQRHLEYIDYYEVSGKPGKVFAAGLTGMNQTVVLSLIQQSAIPEGDYPIKAVADADGAGSLYHSSNLYIGAETASATLTIEPQ